MGLQLTAGTLEGFDAGQAVLDARVNSRAATPNVPTPRGMNGNGAHRQPDLSDLTIEVHLSLDRSFARAIVRDGFQEVVRTDRAILTTAIEDS